MKKSTLIILFCIIIAGITLWFIYYSGRITKKVTAPLQEVHLKLNWLSQAEFAGNYVAIDKGFYSNEGLKVDLVPFTNETPVIDSVATGKADFGVAGAEEILLAREKGIPVKAIAVIYKTNPSVIYSLKKSVIVKPQDLIGKKVGIEQGSDVVYLYDAMLKNLNIDRSKIIESPTGFDASELLDGKVDAETGYSINESNIVKEAGQEVNLIYVEDYGVNVYEDVVFTSENLIKTNPDLVYKFLAGTLDGWQYSIENVNEAVDITLRYATSTTRIHQTDVLNGSIPLINDGISPLGWMDLKRWESTSDILTKEKILTKPTSISDAFTMQFLNEYYQNKKNELKAVF
jgi:ABC-type nitrate/sulfonate/bicarbonate transport system substrate-binding protein